MALRKRPRTPFHDQFPTQGDLAREQCRRLGVPYFSDVQKQMIERMLNLEPASLRAFALACAHRLLTRHERLPEAQREQFTLSWRQVVDQMWSAIEEDSEEVRHAVSSVLEPIRAFLRGDGNAPEIDGDIDEDAAAACIYAAECYLTPDVQTAYWAANRVFESAFSIAEEELQLDPNDFEWDPAAEPMPLVKESMHPLVQQELRRQLSDLQLLETNGVNPGVIRQLRGSTPDSEVSAPAAASSRIGTTSDERGRRASRKPWWKLW
jgi:hypothetical protein